MATAKRQAGRDSRRKARGQRAGRARIAVLRSASDNANYQSTRKMRKGTSGFANPVTQEFGKNEYAKKRLRKSGRTRVVGVRDTMRRAQTGVRKGQTPAATRQVVARNTGRRRFGDKLQTITRANRQLGLVRTEVRLGTRQG